MPWSSGSCEDAQRLTSYFLPPPVVIHPDSEKGRFDAGASATVTKALGARSPSRQFDHERVAVVPRRLGREIGAWAHVDEGRSKKCRGLADLRHRRGPYNPPSRGAGLMGLGDVESLFRCIHKSVLNGGDVGSRTALLPYTRERYFENHKILSSCDKLHKLYASTTEPVVWAPLRRPGAGAHAPLSLGGNSASNFGADAVETIARNRVA
uniref:Fungal_trans domain-containing protein n=1 Tax=Ganoderma boninense TaxID=34458 RepID=A0A5K1K3K8_9APHY|nr:Fungal_trans domain-containing protein [Ganoderma boninense]